VQRRRPLVTPHALTFGTADGRIDEILGLLRRIAAELGVTS
jgi:hypothetical protein